MYERGFCNGLSDCGFSYLLVSSDRTDYAGLRPGAHTLNLRGSQDTRRPAWRKAINYMAYHARLTLHVALHRPPAVHVIGLIWPPFVVGVLEALWFRLFAGSYVLTVHNLLPHDRFTRKNKLLFHWAFRIANTLVVHTPKVRDALIAYHGVPATRIVLVHHGIEPMASTPAPVVPNADTSAWNILFFGKVMRYKGLDILLEALAELGCEFRLVIAGLGNDPVLNAELHAAIAAHPQRDHIVWHNRFIDERELPHLFGTANVLVLPYRHIDQSGVMFQSLRYGVPIVATRVGTFDDYVTPDVGELAARIDAPAFREAMLRCHARRTALTRDQVASAGRRYEWQNVLQPLAGLYGAMPSPHRSDLHAGDVREGKSP